MNLSVIAAIGQNRELGLNNKLLWHIPADMKRFKAITSGHTVIMGRKTFESIGLKPLSNRKNIVLTRNKSVVSTGVTIVTSVQDLLQVINPSEESFIIGGAMVYKLLLPYANKMYLTIVHQNFKADSFFPDYGNEAWEAMEQSAILTDEKSGLEYSFLTLIRNS